MAERRPDLVYSFGRVATRERVYRGRLQVRRRTGDSRPIEAYCVLAEVLLSYKTKLVRLSLDKIRQYEAKDHILCIRVIVFRSYCLASAMYIGKMSPKIFYYWFLSVS